MTGFVGARAKRRRRNFFLILSAIIILIALYLFSQNIEMVENNPMPADTILPDQDDEITSLSSTVEDLNLNLYQKDQKIKFRDGEIKKLKNQIQSLQENLKKIESDYTLIQNDYNNLVNKKKTNNIIEVEQNKIDNYEKNIINLTNQNSLNLKKISKLEDEISSLKIKNSLSNNDNEALKKEYKKILSENFKIKDLVNILKNEIEDQKIMIKELQDVSHHNQ